MNVISDKSTLGRPLDELTILYLGAVCHYFLIFSVFYFSFSIFFRNSKVMVEIEFSLDILCPDFWNRRNFFSGENQDPSC